MNRRTWLAVAGATVLSGMLNPAWAAEPYPNKPIHLVVPFQAGSSPDNTARFLSEKLGPRLGQPIVVENRPGAGGVIGAGALKRAAGDGYALGLFANTHAINIHTYSEAPYDLVQDFTPVAVLAGGPSVLVVTAASPYKTAQDLIDALKKAPGKMNYGSGGKGSIAHLAVENLLHQTGTKAMHIPYKGAPELVTAMLGGQTDFGMPVLSTAAAYLRNGQLRALAVTSSERSPFFPDVPTLAESLPPGFVMDNWSGLFAPAGLPQALKQRLFKEVRALQDEGAFDELLQTNGGELRRNDSPSEFAAMVAEEAESYGKLMRTIGMSGGGV